MSDNNNKRKHYGGGGGGGWGKKQWNRNKEATKSDGHSNGNDDNVNDDDRIQLDSNGNNGSLKLDEIKSSDEYTCRTSYTHLPKRKYAISFGYIGTNYQGLQMNANAVSVEAYLEKALFLSGGFDEFNYGNLHKLSWSRAARTDKGVHAISQCCAMKLRLPENDIPLYITQINSFLPSDIRVFTITKVTGAFNAKSLCSKRRYQYLLPTYLLQSNEILRDILPAKDLTVVEDDGDGNDKVDVLRKVYDVMKQYRVSQDTLVALRNALQIFQGTKSYHNFTYDKNHSAQSFKRYILSFECAEPVIIDDAEFVCLSITGQSFLLNQIRKMVSVAVDVTRGAVSVDAIDQAFQACNSMDVPMITGLGLYLDELYFDQYNIKLSHHTSKKSKGSNTDDDDAKAAEKIDWYANESNATLFNSFRKDVIWPHIARVDAGALEFVAYLHGIVNRPYTYTIKPKKERAVTDTAIVGGASVAIDTATATTAEVE